MDPKLVRFYLIVHWFEDYGADWGYYNVAFDTLEAAQAAAAAEHLAHGNREVTVIQGVAVSHREGE